MKRGIRIRTRLVFAGLITGLVVAVVPPTLDPVDAAHRMSPPRLDPAIAAQVQADPRQTMRVFVHADSIANAVGAARRVPGVKVVDQFDAVDVAVVAAEARLLPRLLQAKGVSRLEADAAIRLLTDTSHKATRSREAREVFKTVTAPDAGPGNDHATDDNPHNDNAQNGKSPTDKPKKNEVDVPAFAETIDGTGVSVAVIDSGVDGTHPMFQRPDGTSSVVHNLKLACHQAAGNEDGSCGPDHDTLWLDMNATNDSDSPSNGGHGTHVASTVAGRDVRIAEDRVVSGSAPGAEIVALSVGQVLNVYGGTAGLLWVLDHHADPCGDKSCAPIKVVNNSWGPVIVGQRYDPESVVAKVQNQLVGAGVTVVWSGGNGDAAGDGGDGSDVRTSIYGQSPTPGILMVANYDDADSGTRNGIIDSSSSRGQQGLVATYPDLAAPGTGITAACRAQLPVCQAGEIGATSLDYGTIGGTSMAAPHVAGIVAQLLQVDPTLTPAAIEDVLEDTAYKTRAGAIYEADLPEANDGTTSFDKGHGLVDATAAIASLLGVPTPASDPEQDPFAHCAPDGPVVTDPEGDATQFAAANGTPNEPGLDITELRLREDAENLTFVFRLADLRETPAALSLGNSIETDFTASSPYSLSVAWANGAAPSASFGQGDLVGGYTQVAAPVPVLDYEADTITVAVARAAFEPDLVKGSALSGFAVRTRYDESPTPLGPVADDSVGSPTCPYTVGYGAIPPPPGSEPPPPPPVEPKPDATLTPGGAAYAWSGASSTASDTLIGPMVTVTGKVHDTRLVRLDLTDGSTGSLTVTVDTPPTAYVLFEVFDAKGARVAYYEGIPTEVFTVVMPGLVAGNYTIDIGYFVAAEAVYSATATLS